MRKQKQRVDSRRPRRRSSPSWVVFAAFVAVSLLSTRTCESKTTTATGSADWNLATNWDNGNPGGGDIVFIPSPYTITLGQTEPGPHAGGVTTISAGASIVAVNDAVLYLTGPLIVIGTGRVTIDLRAASADFQCLNVSIAPTAELFIITDSSTISGATLEHVGGSATDVVSVRGGNLTLHHFPASTSPVKHSSLNLTRVAQSGDLGIMQFQANTRAIDIDEFKVITASGYCTPIELTLLPAGSMPHARFGSLYIHVLARITTFSLGSLNGLEIGEFVSYGGEMEFHGADNSVAITGRVDIVNGGGPTAPDFRFHQAVTFSQSVSMPTCALSFFGTDTSARLVLLYVTVPDRTISSLTRACGSGDSFLGGQLQSNIGSTNQIIDAMNPGALTSVAFATANVGVSSIITFTCHSAHCTLDLGTITQPSANGGPVTFVGPGSIDWSWTAGNNWYLCDLVVNSTALNVLNDPSQFRDLSLSGGASLTQTAGISAARWYLYGPLPLAISASTIITFYGTIEVWTADLTLTPVGPTTITFGQIPSQFLPVTSANLFIRSVEIGQQVSFSLGCNPNVGYIPGWTGVFDVSMSPNGGKLQLEGPAMENGFLFDRPIVVRSGWLNLYAFTVPTTGSFTVPELTLYADALFGSTNTEPWFNTTVTGLCTFYGGVTPAGTQFSSTGLLCNSTVMTPGKVAVATTSVWLSFGALLILNATNLIVMPPPLADRLSPLIPPNYDLISTGISFITISPKALPFSGAAHRMDFLGKIHTGTNNASDVLRLEQTPFHLGEITGGGTLIIDCAGESLDLTFESIVPSSTAPIEIHRSCDSTFPAVVARPVAFSLVGRIVSPWTVTFTESLADTPNDPAWYRINGDIVVNGTLVVTASFEWKFETGDSVYLNGPIRCEGGGPTFTLAAVARIYEVYSPNADEFGNVAFSDMTRVQFMLPHYVLNSVSFSTTPALNNVPCVVELPANADVLIYNMQFLQPIITNLTGSASILRIGDIGDNYNYDSLYVLAEAGSLIEFGHVRTRGLLHALTVHAYRPSDPLSPSYTLPVRVSTRNWEDSWPVIVTFESNDTTDIVWTNDPFANQSFIGSVVLDSNGVVSYAGENLDLQELLFGSTNPVSTWRMLHPDANLSVQLCGFDAPGAINFTFTGSSLFSCNQLPVGNTIARALRLTLDADPFGLSGLSLPDNQIFSGAGMIEMNIRGMDGVVALRMGQSTDAVIRFVTAPAVNASVHVYWHTSYNYNTRLRVTGGAPTLHVEGHITSGLPDGPTLCGAVNFQIERSRTYFESLQFGPGSVVNGSNAHLSLNSSSFLTGGRVLGSGMTIELANVYVNDIFWGAATGTILLSGGTHFETTPSFAQLGAPLAAFTRVAVAGVTTVNGTNSLDLLRVTFGGTSVLHLIDQRVSFTAGSVRTITYSYNGGGSPPGITLYSSARLAPGCNIRSAVATAYPGFDVSMTGGEIGDGCTLADLSYFEADGNARIGVGVTISSHDMVFYGLNNSIAGPITGVKAFALRTDSELRLGPGSYRIDQLKTENTFRLTGGAAVALATDYFELVTNVGTTATGVIDGGLSVRTDRMQYYIDQLSRLTLSLRDHSLLNISSILAVDCGSCGSAVTNANITVQSNATIVHRGTNVTGAWLFGSTVLPKFVIQSCVNAPYVPVPSTITLLPAPDNHLCGVSPCASNPCQNGGTCSANAFGYTCFCVPSLWAGATCTTSVAPVDPCASVACQHGGACVVSGNTASCNCPSQYWIGPRCDDWVDPCLLRPCFFDETCVNGGVNSTTRTCTCLVAACGAGTSPAAIQTAAQRDAVIPALVTLAPSSAPSIGGVQMVLTTRGFTGTFVLRVSNQPPGGSGGGALNGSTTQHLRAFAADESVVLSDPIPFNQTPDASVDSYFRQFKLSFIAPPYAVSKSAYRSIVLSVTPDDGSATVSLVLRSDSLLYVPFNPCLDPGVSLAYTNGVPYCGPCPRGGLCPGGGRIWPVAGFWSTSEYATPIECTVPEACPGSESTGHRTNADGSTVTSVCAEGYTGYSCSQCQSSYYQSGLRCFSCGSSQSDTQQLQFLIAAAIIIFVALSIAVATLSSRWLALVVTCLIAVQQFVTIGKSAVQRLPASVDPLVQLLNFLSVVNFDVQMVKPGCIVPQLTFLSLYWTTIVLVVVSMFLFAGGAAVRATWVYHFRLKGMTRVDPVTTATDASGTATAGGTGADRQISIRAGTRRTVESSPATEAGGSGGASAVALEIDSSAVISPKNAKSPKSGRASGRGNGRSGEADRRELVHDSTGGVITTDERDWASTWCDVFTARLIQSLLILGTLMFLKIFTLCLQCANCEQLSGVEADESGAGAETTLRLVIDPTQVCYSGPHASAIVFDYFVLIIYGAGFPALSFFLLYRTFRGRTTGGDSTTGLIALTPAEAEERRRADAKRADHYGYLYRGLITAAWYFRMFTFITTWGFGLQLVFARSIHVQVFVPGVFFLVNVTLVGQLWPYTNNFNNFLSVAVGFGGALQVMVYLGVLGNSNPATRSSIYVFLYWMAALTAVSIAFVLYSRFRDRSRKAKTLERVLNDPKAAEAVKYLQTLEAEKQND